MIPRLWYWIMGAVAAAFMLIALLIPGPAVAETTPIDAPEPTPLAAPCMLLDKIEAEAALYGNEMGIVDLALMFSGRFVAVQLVMVAGVDGLRVGVQFDNGCVSEPALFIPRAP